MNLVDCPVCEHSSQPGIIKYFGYAFKNHMIVYKEKVDDCPLCDAYGRIQITETTDVSRRSNTGEGDFHPGRSSVVKEFKGDWIFLFEERQQTGSRSEDIR